MSGVPIATTLGLLLSFFCLLGVAVLFWLALRRPPVRRPSCGSCGYAVEGLETLSCPECGCDLRQVGIETPRRRMLHPGLFILFWSLLLVAPFLTAFGIAMRVGPRSIVANATFGLTTASGRMPQLSIDQRVEAAGAGFGGGFFVSSATEAVTDSGGVETATIWFPKISGATPRVWTVDVRTAADAVQGKASRLTVDSADGAMAMDPATLDVVFGAADAAAPEDKAEVAALLNAMMNGEAGYQTTRLRMAGNNIVQSTTAKPGWYAPTLAAIGVALYVLGIVVYLMLRRKRLAAD